VNPAPAAGARVNKPLATSKSSPLAIINNYFTSLEQKGGKAGANEKTFIRSLRASPPFLLSQESTGDERGNLLFYGLDYFVPLAMTKSELQSERHL